ncbi:MAG: response regulator transcription factor [Sulfurospirillum sp.]
MIDIAMIEDDEQLADILASYLGQFDIQVTNYPDPFIGLSAINLERDKFNLIILDLTLPGLDGVEVCRDLVKLDIPIIISSARSDIEDKIKTLEIGADDYLSKPYEPKELELRIKSVLRRYGAKKKSEGLKKEELFRVKSNTIYLKKTPLDLTQAEFQVLGLLIERKNSIVPRFDIYDSCDFFHSEDASGSLNVIMTRIKKKIGKKYIKTIKGMGYKLEC